MPKCAATPYAIREKDTRKKGKTWGGEAEFKMAFVLVYWGTNWWGRQTDRPGMAGILEATNDFNLCAIYRRMAGTNEDR